MKTLREIKFILASKKDYLFEKYPLASIGIFGSYARNEQNEQSDIDVIVDINGRIGIDFIRLANEIESYFDKKVDVVSKRGVKEKYMKEIEPDIIYV